MLWFGTFWCQMGLTVRTLRTNEKHFCSYTHPRLNPPASWAFMFLQMPCSSTSAALMSCLSLQPLRELSTYSVCAGFDFFSFTFATLAHFRSSNKHGAHIHPALHRLQKHKLSKQQQNSISLPHLIFCSGIHKPGSVVFGLCHHSLTVVSVKKKRKKRNLLKKSCVIFLSLTSLTLLI